MFKNPFVFFILGVALLAWAVYDLTAPGEAQPAIVIGMHLFAALGGAIWVVLGLVGMLAGKRASEPGKRG
jgi:hypothetical protein